MRIAFISDIHENIDALNAVLADIENEHAEEVFRLEKDAENQVKQLLKRGFADILLFYGPPDEQSELLDDCLDHQKYHKTIKTHPADIYVHCHVQKPYIKMVDHKIFVSCGSVTQSDKAGFANYALMDIDDNSVAVQIVNVPYSSRLGSARQGNNKLASLI